jgi:hypothetical protein
MILKFISIITFAIMVQCSDQISKPSCIEQIEMITPVIIDKDLNTENYPLFKKTTIPIKVSVNYLSSKSNYRIATGELILSLRGNLEFENSSISFYFCDEFFVNVPLYKSEVLGTSGYFEFKGLNGVDNFEIQFNNSKKISLIYNDLNNIYDVECHSDTLFIKSVENLIAPY